MLARSVPVAEVPAELAPLVPEGGARVFVGNLVPLVTRDLGMTSLESYHARKHELRRMGCIQQLQRGARYRAGAWALLGPPTVDLWNLHVRRPFSRKREQEVREWHAQRLVSFVEASPVLFPRLLAEARAAGARTGADLLGYLAGLPERRLRALRPLCLGYAVQGAPHTCGVPGLDVLVPSHAAGSWKRRADHLCKLAAE